MTARQRNAILAIVLLLAAALRLWSAATAPPPAKDAALMDALACRIAAGRGFCGPDGQPTAWYPPGYPGFLAGLHALFGASLVPARAADCIFGVLTCLGLFLAGRRLADQRIGLAAAAVWAVNPLAWDSYFAAGMLCTEVLVTLLLLAAMVALWLVFTTWRTVWSAVAGVLMGALIMIKTALVLWPLFLAPLWLAGAIGRRSWRPVLQGAITALILLAIVLPWTIRNYRVLGAWPVLSTNGGLTFWRSNNPTSDGGGTYPEGTLERYQEVGEQERSVRFYGDGWEYLGQNRGRIPWLLYRKTRMLLDVFYPSRLTGNPVCNWWYVLLCPPAVVGFFVLGKRHPWWNAVVTMTVLQIWFVTLLFHAYPRYRFPYEPFLVLWAMIGVSWISARLTTAGANVAPLTANREWGELDEGDRRPDARM